MSRIEISRDIDLIVSELGLGDAGAVLKDSLATEILSRISDFAEEVKAYERKYGVSLAEAKRRSALRSEDFQESDDLNAWEFAAQGKEYWEAKLGDIRRAL